MSEDIPPIQDQSDSEDLEERIYAYDETDPSYTSNTDKKLIEMG